MSAEDIESFNWALQTGDLDGPTGVKFFIEKKGFDVNQKSSATPIMTAADYGHEQVILYLIEKGAKVNEKDSFGNTPLLNAVYENHFNAVKVLLEKGASKDVVGPDGKKAVDATDNDEIKALLK